MTIRHRMRIGDITKPYYVNRDAEEITVEEWRKLRQCVSYKTDAICEMPGSKLTAGYWGKLEVPEVFQRREMKIFCLTLCTRAVENPYDPSGDWVFNSRYTYAFRSNLIREFKRIRRQWFLDMMKAKREGDDRVWMIRDFINDGNMKRSEILSSANHPKGRGTFHHYSDRSGSW